MTVTLFDLTLDLARLLGVVSEGVATGGSTTTIADTVERVEDDDYWNSGTAWITYDAAGAGAAPQGEYSFVSDYALSGGLLTLRSTLTAAVAANDRYAVAAKRYPLQILIQKINEAQGVIEKVDTSTVVIASDQREYNLPADVLELKQVLVQTNLDDSDDNGWEKIYDWDTEKTAVGTADKLILMRQFSAGYAVKLVYTAYHAVLRVATDKLDENIHKKKIIYSAQVGCLLWRKSRVGDSDQSVNALLDYAQAKLAEVNQDFPQHLPPRSAKTIHPVLR